MLGIAATALAGAAAATGAAVYRNKRSRTARLERARAEAAAITAGSEDLLRQELERVRQQAERHRRRLTDDIEALDDAVRSDAERLDRAQRALERRGELVDARDVDLGQRFDSFRERRVAVRVRLEEVGALEAEFDRSVERAAGVTRREVVAEIGREFGDRARVAADRARRAMEDGALGQSEQEARRLMDVACHRYGAPLKTNRLVAQVHLPESSKQVERLLADNRAVLRAITEHSEVDFIDRDDGAMYLAAPDPYTREIGRLTYERLLKTGRITESAAVAGVAKARVDLEKIARDAGNRARKVLGLRPIDGEILFLVGKLLYRTSYTQNQWGHAIETAHLCGMMAQDMGLDLRLARRSALMHDIGKVLWAETEAVGSHAVSGAAFAAAHGEPPEVVHPIAAHHGDEKPSTALAHLVAAADALSGARPGARRETVLSYAQRVDDLQRICGDFDEIKKSFVIQGGREVRVEVDPRRTDDRQAARLSDEVARRIEDECTYPGQIKVTVIREVLSSATAR